MTKVLSSMEKKAAYAALLENGASFDEAVELIKKQAGFAGEAMALGKRMGSVVGGKAKDFATAMKNDSGHVMDQVRAIKTGKTTLNGARFKTQVNIGRGAAVKQLAGNRAIQGSVGAAAAGGAAVGAVMSRPSAPQQNQEKQACLKELLNQGINFDDAVALVKQAEQDVYGK